MSNRCALRIPDLHSEGLLQVQPRLPWEICKIPDWRLMQCKAVGSGKRVPNPFKISSKIHHRQDSPRGKMFSCSMVSQILFIWSSLRAPPMRRFFCTWSPKWKTAEAILGRAAQSQVPEHVSWLSHGESARPNRLGWLGLSHSLSKWSHVWGLQEYCVVLRQPTTSHRCVGFLFSIQRTRRCEHGDVNKRSKAPATHGQLEDLSIALCHDAQLAPQQK